MSRYLHIICPENPLPADNGRHIDIINRMMILKKAGISIHLHVFTQDDLAGSSLLNEYCEKLVTYPVKNKYHSSLPDLPLHISIYSNEDLIRSLTENDWPILMEGIPCASLLDSIKVANRKIIVRIYQDKNVTGKDDSWADTNIFSRVSFLSKKHQLKKYISQLNGKCVFACSSLQESALLQSDYNLDEIMVLSLFPGWQEITGKEGVGNFCLYHGNLSIPENEEAALWLLEKVFTKIKVPLVIAGKSPSARVEKIAHLYQHTCLVADPSEKEMDDLVKKAHINVLPSFKKNHKGTCIKLLHALYEGRHCVVNNRMVEDTGLESACHIGETANAIASIISQLYHYPFAIEEIRLREKLLSGLYDNENNARQLIAYLW